MDDKKPVPPSLAQFAVDQLTAKAPVKSLYVEVLRDEYEGLRARIAELEAELALSNECLDMANENYAALKPQPSAGVVLPERMVKTETSSDEYDMCADTHNACLDEVARLNPCRAQSVPDGWMLVPERMHLDANVIEAINYHCGDGQEDAGYGQHTDGLLWVGFMEDDDGVKSYGLNIATAEYPEEGSTQLVEFAAPSAKKES